MRLSESKKDSGGRGNRKHTDSHSSKHRAGFAEDKVGGVIKLLRISNGEVYV